MEDLLCDDDWAEREGVTDTVWFQNPDEFLNNIRVYNKVPPHPALEAALTEVATRLIGDKAPLLVAALLEQ